VDVPKDCTDKTKVALYARPTEFLTPEVRKSQSSWRFLPEGVEERFLRDLQTDLASGAWQEKYEKLAEQAHIRCQLRLVVSNVV
jgi:hypothetical protein